MMPTSQPCILPTIRVWLGGSFDPVHHGHLAIIEHIYQQLQRHLPDYPKQLYLLPTAGSPLKEHPTPAADRLAMLHLASQDHPYLNIDETEIDMPPPVFTIDTLQLFAKRYPNDIRIFVLGEDSILSLAKWKNGFELIDWANLWVLPRPALNGRHNAVIDKTMAESLAKQVDTVLQKYVILSAASFMDSLIDSQYAHIYIDNYVPPHVSSSAIRMQLTAGESSNDLPLAVQAFIKQKKLYRR